MTVTIGIICLAVGAGIGLLTYTLSWQTQVGAFLIVATWTVLLLEAASMI